MYKKIGLFVVVLITLAGCSSLKQQTRQAGKPSQLTEAEQQQFYYYFYEGVRLENDEKYDQALETYLLCYKLDSLNAGLNFNIGQLYAVIGFTGEATKFMAKAVELEPENWWYNNGLINMLWEQKQWEPAIERATALQKIYPYKENVYFMLASLYTQAKQFDKAIGAYDQMEKFIGINEAISLEKYRLYRQTGKTKKGIAEIDKLIEAFPAETDYLVVRGDIYFEEGMPDKAFETYQQILRDDPQNPHVYISLANYYELNDQPEKAVESIVNALKNDHLDVDTKMDILGRYIENRYVSEKRIDETEDLFKLLVDRYPLEEQVHIYYAIFLQYQKRYDDMKDELETILYINPKNDKAWLQLIQLHLAEEEMEKVVEITSRAIENLPEDLRFYFYKSISQSILKEYDAALETGLAATALFNQDTNSALASDIYSQVGDIYYSLGKKEKAFEAYDNALKTNPGNVGAMNNYAYYLSLEKESLKRAELLSAKTVEMEPKNSTFLDTYAWVLYQQGNYSLAKFYIERAMDNLHSEHDPGVIYDHYGDILWKTGSPEKAVEMWQKALDSGLDTDELKQKVEAKSLITEIEK